MYISLRQRLYLVHTRASLCVSSFYDWIKSEKEKRRHKEEEMAAVAAAKAKEESENETDAFIYLSVFVLF
jgi:hypothetical protein